MRLSIVNTGCFSIGSLHPNKSVYYGIKLCWRPSYSEGSLEGRPFFVLHSVNSGGCFVCILRALQSPTNLCTRSNSQKRFGGKLFGTELIQFYCTRRIKKLQWRHCCVFFANYSHNSYCLLKLQIVVIYCITVRNLYELDMSTKPPIHPISWENSVNFVCICIMCD